MGQDPDESLIEIELKKNKNIEIIHNEGDIIIFKKKDGAKIFVHNKRAENHINEGGNFILSSFGPALVVTTLTGQIWHKNTTSGEEVRITGWKG